MDSTGYRIQSLLTLDANMEHARTSGTDTSERTAQVAVDGPSYGGPPDRRVTDMVHQLGGLPLHKPYDYLGINSHSQNLTSGSVSGYGSVSTCESFRNVNSESWNWYTPDVGRNSSLDVELQSPSLCSGRIPARTITGQDEEEEEYPNTQLKPTTSGHVGYRTSSTTALNSINISQHSTRVRQIFTMIQ